MTLAPAPSTRFLRARAGLIFCKDNTLFRKMTKISEKTFTRRKIMAHEVLKSFVFLLFFARTFVLWLTPKVLTLEKTKLLFCFLLA